MKISARPAVLLERQRARRGSAPARRRRASRPARRRSARPARARARRRSRRAGAGRRRAGAGSARRSAPARGRRRRAPRSTRSACSAFGTPWTSSGSATIVAHPLARVERLVGVLEDHLHAPAELGRAPACPRPPRRRAATRRPVALDCRPSIARASVDLPQPDSPTMPRISPLRHSSETPSTARAVRRGPELDPRSRISISASTHATPSMIVAGGSSRPRVQGAK